MVIESADELIKKLEVACKHRGLVTDVVEPSTRIKVFAPSGNAHLDEMVSLRPNESEVLTWHWSWGDPICPATDVDQAAKRIENVVSVTVA
jgi:hypothetical protein